MNPISFYIFSTAFYSLVVVLVWRSPVVASKRKVNRCCVYGSWSIPVATSLLVLLLHSNALYRNIHSDPVCCLGFNYNTEKWQ